MCDLNLTATDVDNLKVIPYFTSSSIQHELKLELPKYVAAAEGVSSSVDKLNWWKNHERDLPNWSSSCKVALLLQPSSAAAERFFSILTNSFSNRQASSREDYIEISIMLQYNNS